MNKNVLFLQGGGNGGYEADARLVASLQARLGTAYQIHYPRLQIDESAPDFGWPRQIGKEIKVITGDIVLVAHSLGASIVNEIPFGKQN